MALKNKKTSAAGILMVVSGLCIVVATWLGGGDIMEAVKISLLPAIGGLGLLGASDGSA